MLKKLLEILGMVNNLQMLYKSVFENYVCIHLPYERDVCSLDFLSKLSQIYDFMISSSSAATYLQIWVPHKDLIIGPFWNIWKKCNT